MPTAAAQGFSLCRIYVQKETGKCPMDYRSAPPCGSVTGIEAHHLYLRVEWLAAQILPAKVRHSSARLS
jgi:hypothetical protein